MPNRLKLDISDPANPYTRVRTVEIDCKIQFTGDEAWNQNILLPRLEKYLRDHSYDLRSFKATKYWDKNKQEIQEDEFRDYIYERHGHGMNTRCSSCPDPVRWKEAERLARRIQQQEGKLQGKKKKHRTRTIYIMETKEERAKRKQVEKGKIDIEGVDLVKGGGNRIEEY